MGSALKLGQVEAARSLGYRAVASDTTLESVKRIVSKMGGTVQPGGVAAWTLVSTDTQPRGEKS